MSNKFNPNDPQYLEDLQKAVDNELKQPEPPDQIQDNEPIENVSQSEEETPNEVDPYLDEAIKMGYNPNYKGPNKKNPEQFVRDGSFFKKIDEQKKEIQDLKQLFKEQVEHSRKVERAADEQKLREIQLSKRERIAEADLHGHDALEAQERAIQQRLQDNKPVQEKTPEGNVVTPAIRQFLEDNKDWCNVDTDENQEMAMYADMMAKRESMKNPTKSENDILYDVKKLVEKRYPHRFNNLATKRPATVGKSTSREVSANAAASKLTREQKAYVDKANLYGANLSYEEYAKQLKLIGALRDE